MQITLNDDAIKKAQTDPEVLSAVIEIMEPLVRSIAAKYERTAKEVGGIDIEDLMQSGRMAVMDALKSYNAEKEKQFKYWCGWYINNSCKRTIGLTSTKDKITIISLDAPLPDNDDVTLHDIISADREYSVFISPEDSIIQNEIKKTVRDAVDLLPDGERRAVYDEYLSQNSHREKNPGEARKALRDLRKNRTLKRLHDALTYSSDNYRSSFLRWSCTGNSAVEEAVIRREEIRKKADCIITQCDNEYDAEQMRKLMERW